MKSPRANAPVSVVIAMYNATAYIQAALESVLVQADSIREIIVVDDGSTDASPEVVARYPEVRLVRQANGGPGLAVNHGVALARGEYLAFLDADDLWAPGKLARQLASMAESTPPDMVLGHVQNFHSPELSADLRQAIECPPAPLEGYALGALLIRRENFQRVGPLATNLTIGHFIEWFTRAHDLGLTTRMLPEVLLHRRLHADNLSRRERTARPQFARIMKMALDRRRAAGNSTPPR